MAVMALSGLAMVAAGCSGDGSTGTGTSDIPTKELKIKSVNPASVFIEGTDIVTLVTENGCGKDKAEIDIGGITITGAQIQATDNDHYTFTAPADGTLATPTSQAVVKPIKLKCSAAPTTTWKYAKLPAEASASIKYDPDLEPQPTIKTPSPLGGDAHSNGVSVLAKMTVVFTRAINPDTVTKDSFSISEVTGQITHEADNKTFYFKPDQQLQYAKQYTCKVTTAVKSAFRGKALKTTIAPNNGTPDPAFDEWTFTTRCEGCGNPWLGDISAAAGISSGGSYKLFSVTGQPTPVGEASNDQYKLQSGFIYATAPTTTP
jgi:hypothetical protein